MKQYKSYKYRIYPTKEQEILLSKTFGCVRWVYNWGLAYKISAYEKTKNGISSFALAKEMAKLKDIQDTAWLSEVSSQSLQNSLGNLDMAYTRFFKEKKGFPKFKSRRNKQSFSNPQRTVVDWKTNLVFIPKFQEGIKIVLHRKFEGKIKKSTVTRTPSGKYFISILVETETINLIPKTPVENKTLGIDLGITNFLTDSNGDTIANPKHLAKKLKSLKRQQRKLSRKKNGSNNRNKQRLKVAKLYEKVANCRKDFLHKITHQLTENQGYDSIAIESLDIVGMLKNGKKNKLARHISDVGWGMFREFLTYKCKEKGKNLLVIGQFEPSSKLCACGFLNNDLTLKDREWDCPVCKTHHNRDVLAANNIKRFAFCKQNTSKLLVGQELPEFTLGKSGVSHSLSQEMTAFTNVV